MRYGVAFPDGQSTQVALGGSYRPGDHLQLMVEGYHTTGAPLRVAAGLEYAVEESIRLRTGLRSGPTELSFGVGYRLFERLELGVTAVYHEQLGVTPLAGVVLHP